MKKLLVTLFSSDGRQRRRKHAVYLFIIFLLFVMLGMLWRMGLRNEDWRSRLMALTFFWMLFAQGAKRCHDLGRNGWWQLIPFYWIWMLFKDGQHGSNRYGEDPKKRSMEKQ